MGAVKQLLKDTAIYGLSSIIGRFLNWLLVALYTRILLETSDYGIVNYLYSWTALLLVILTFGMETGFFRFAKDETDHGKVYSTSLISVSAVAFLFLVVTIMFSNDIANSLGALGHNDYIVMLALILFFDSISSIPFARLRYQNRPMKFAFLKLLSVGVNIILNLFFLLVLPWASTTFPNISFIDVIYDENFLVGYILLSNVISSAIIFLFLTNEIFTLKAAFNWPLFKTMFNYSWPILVIGVAGIFNQYGSQILFPVLITDPIEAGRQLGVYGANYKIAVIMVMFVQAFRFAYEPFIFRSSKNSDARAVYAHVMKVFVIVGMFIFLGVTLFIDVVKYFIGSNYHSGVNVVPIVLIGNLFFGVYFNLSVWYKLNDKTYIGSWLAIMGSFITLLVVVLFLPSYGYIAAAWANVICFGIMMIVSYLLERKYFAIPYDTTRISIYFASGILLYFSSFLASDSSLMVKFVFHSFIILIFLVLVVYFEKVNYQQILNLIKWKK